MLLLLTISAEKVIVMICGPFALPSPGDEAIISRLVESIFKDTGKGVVVWVKENQLPAPNVLLELIVRPMSSIMNTESQTSSSEDFSRSANTAQAAANVPADRQYIETPQAGHMTSPPQQQTRWHPLQYGRNVHQSQRTMPNQPTASSSSGTGYVPPRGELLMLKARLLSGRISYQRGHVEIVQPGFVVPDYITETLRETHLNTPEAVVKIMRDKSGRLRCSVEPKSKSKTSQEQHSQSATEDEESLFLAKNETVMLHTRVRYGQISFEQGALEFIYPEWKTPNCIVQCLKDEFWATPDGELFVISDEKGNLRLKVLTRRKARALDIFNKVKTNVKNTFS